MGSAPELLISRPVVVPYFRDLRYVIFQQDNVRMHIDVVYWPNSMQKEFDSCPGENALLISHPLKSFDHGLLRRRATTFL
ncbi:hypothetical protein TNCV_1842751 [Trichonephila clavipes]|nr:hypothetical protein TNCV_1842751 [Trichonephila clavipes]